MAARAWSGLRSLSQIQLGCGRFRTCCRVNLSLSRGLTVFPVPTVRSSQAFLKSRCTNPTSFIRHRLPSWHQLAAIQPYSSSSAGDEGEEDEEKKPADEQDSDGDESLGLLAPIVKQYAVAPVSIPDRYPEVPVLPISRNPIFPRFVKMVEVCLCVCTCDSV